MNEIREKILEVRARMAKAALQAGRNPGNIKLMAVSKAVSPERVAAAIAAGVDIVGENYLQEAQSKEATLVIAPALHFIGHLQSNKAKFAVRLFDMIHSIDRPELAEELNKRAAALGKIQDILLEINMGGEETKSGVAPAAAATLLERIAPLVNLRVCGLMTIPPPFFDGKETRLCFANLFRLCETLRLLQIPNAPLTELSMGMSNDYEMAIQEGATIVRIGRGIFGKRPSRVCNVR